MHRGRTQVQFHMKKGSIIVFCLICILGALWWSGNKPEPIENPSIAFAGFHTRPATNFILFRVSRVPADVRWKPMMLERKEPTGWMPLPKPTSWLSYRKGDDHFVGVPTATTNGQWRISLSYQKRRTGLHGIYDRISATSARVFQNQHYNLYRGSTVLVTNNLAVAKEGQ
jgi:hypothetical protein